MDKEINCSNCTAACCGPNIQVKITARERDFLRAAGTIVEEVVPPVPMNVYFATKPADPTLFETMKGSELPKDHGVYILRTRCGYVVEENGWLKCGAYYNPRRPGVCSGFPEGLDACQEIKRSRGVDTK